MKGKKLRGPEQAAVYAYPPAALGYCGDLDKRRMIKAYLSQSEPDERYKRRLRETLTGFKGAYAYYQLIARVNGIEDPLDPNVVEAYWIGNDLLEQVKRPDLQEMIVNNFVKQGLLENHAAQEIATHIPEGVIAHHSFQVFFLEPAMGQTSFYSPRVYDLCLIRCGRVVSKSRNDQLNTIPVLYPSLGGQDGRFFFNQDEPTRREINWSMRYLPPVDIGAWVSFHWNKGCQILTEDQVARLNQNNERNLQAFNELHR